MVPARRRFAILWVGTILYEITAKFFTNVGLTAGCGGQTACGYAGLRPTDESSVRRQFTIVRKAGKIRPYLVIPVRRKSLQ